MTWESSLRAAGLRVTRPRLLVASALAEMGGHHSADDILEHLERAGTPLPRASVYNVVEALVAADIATEAFHGPGRALYEITDEPHDHFVCTTCDEVIDVPRTGHVGVPTHPAAAVVSDVAVIYRGLCPACA